MLKTHPTHLANQARCFEDFARSDHLNGLGNTKEASNRSSALEVTQESVREITLSSASTAATANYPLTCCQDSAEAPFKI